MALNEREQHYHKKLKETLQQGGDASKFEQLAAALLDRLLGVPIVVAQSGFQHGGDAGTAGQQGRRLRLECKKYSDTSPLNERELLGEIDQALARDQALEAWLLVSTRAVPEQLQQSLVQKGEKVGVPIVIIDWTEHEGAPLAALCASDPNLVEKQFSQEAGEAARALQTVSNNTIERLRRNLQSWGLGYDTLRILSHARLEKIWKSPQESNAKLGQNAAGGSEAKRIKRTTIDDSLSNWWQGSARDGAPVAVVGLEGTGKTWATLAWLVDNRDEQPIVLVVPSSVMADFSPVSETNVKQFLAARLYEISGVRNQEHWLRRLDNLLKRPTEEGAALTIFFDGLNQEPSVQWLQLLKILQGESFTGRVRVIVSTRTHYFEGRLSELGSLVVPAERVNACLYDITPGGELDQMLEFEGLSRADLHPDVIESARNPRLFKLVVRFREKLVEPYQVTIHRLLWEYGRDALGVRAGRSFSEEEWRDWLKEIAQKHLDGIKEYSVKSLGETVYRPDLNPGDVYNRLSDIIDGRFASHDPTGNLQLTPEAVAQALGVVLLSHLDQVTIPDFDNLDAQLTKWLDPIEGLDEQAEILRAAVSILVEEGRAAESSIPGVLVTAWLQAQNITDTHRLELACLAPHFPDALLDAVERSRSHTSARIWAVKALRAIPSTAGESLTSAALSTIIKRACRWMSVVSRDVDIRPEHDEWHSDRLKRLIGIDSSQPIKVVDVEIELVDNPYGLPAFNVPSIIQAFPLAEALPIFEVAAVSFAISRGLGGNWDDLKWICLLNEIDPEETAKALRSLSQEVSLRIPETGVHPEFPKRVASLLLRLTGHKADEEAAGAIDPDLEEFPTYEKDYLPQPSRSLFPLERRHAGVTLSDTTLPLHYRVKRTKEIWLDPSFTPPVAFVAELRREAQRIDVEKLDRSLGVTSEDHDFEEIEPVLARCAPDLLANLIRRKMQSLLAAGPSESRYLSAVRATDHLILAEEAEVAAARTLRASAGADNKDDEAYATEKLLLLEVQNMRPQAQFDLLIGLDLKYILSDFSKVLRPPTPDDIDALIARYAPSSSSRQRDLLILLSCCLSGYPVNSPIRLTDKAWTWIESFVKQKAGDSRRFAFKILARADPARFGRTLVAENWSWSPDEHDWINHYGTGALIKATATLLFHELVPRLAPWRLLEAARLRGTIPTEVRLAAEFFVQKSIPDNIRVNAKDFKPVLIHAGDIIEQWIEGYCEVTEVFQWRVHSAEKAFLGLCEALLAHDPEKGVQLWRALDHDWTMTTRYMGAANVEDRLHMVFRVPASPAVLKLREELIGLKSCHHDQKLLDLAIAASYNGQSDWLNAAIETGRTAALVWHRNRAAVLRGFTSNNSLPVVDAWPDGNSKAGHADLARRSARYRWVEACAHHWWRAFLNARTPAEAYAAWVLFLRSADRRAWLWIHQEVKAADDASEFFRLKMNHANLHLPTLKKAMKKQEGEPFSKLDRQFLYRKISSGVGPWPDIPFE